jgi:hypothetical protein
MVVVAFNLVILTNLTALLSGFRYKSANALMGAVRLYLVSDLNIFLGVVHQIVQDGSNLAEFGLDQIQSHVELGFDFDRPRNIIQVIPKSFFQRFLGLSF